MRNRQFVFVAVVLAAIGAACSEMDVVGISDYEQIAVTPAAAQQDCSSWSCTWGSCGYDPASDPRGACCVEGAYESGNPVKPKPSGCWPDSPTTTSGYWECNVADNFCIDNQLETGTPCPGYCEVTDACKKDIGAFQCEIT